MFDRTPGQSGISRVLTHCRCRLVDTLRRGCWLVELLLSCETDENLRELLDVERITTLVAHAEPSRIGATHTRLPVSFDAHCPPRFPLASSLHVTASHRTADQALGQILTVADVGEITGPLAAGVLARATWLRVGLSCCPALVLVAALTDRAQRPALNPARQYADQRIA